LFLTAHVYKSTSDLTVMAKVLVSAMVDPPLTPRSFFL
jgi:hypothetical protein